MRLSILLFSLISVVWSQSYESESNSIESFETELEEYKNLWRETLVEADAAAPGLNCANDGFFYGNGNCSCKPNFVKEICSQRLCQNAGQPRNTLNYGCRCPPGFLGSSCEPVKCVPGSSNSYYQTPAQQSISLLVMYNADFMAKSVNDLPTDAFCDSFQTGKYSKAYVQIGSDAVYGIENVRNSTDCKSKIQGYLDAVCVDEQEPPNKIPCPDTDVLTYEMILTTVENTLPNSQVFIVSTIPINDTNSTTRHVLLAKATANKIQIHALMYAQPTIQFDDYYNSDVYKDTRSLVEATFGYFVTPYSAASKNLYGNQSVTQTLTKLASLKSNGFETIFIIKSDSSPLPIMFAGGNTFYLAFRTMDISQLDDSTIQADITWIPASTTMSLDTDTGFFKIYKVTQTEATPATVSLGTNNLAKFNFYILSQNGMKSYAAITTDLSVDAYSPYGLISGVSHTLAVNALTPNTVVINRVNVNTSESSASLVFNPNRSTRDGCQFNIVLGDIQCHDNIPVTILLQDQSQLSAAIPFYCVDSDFMIANVNNQARRLFQDDETSTDATIQTTPPQTDAACQPATVNLVKKTNDRSFVIISRQTSDSNPNISSVYNLYVKPGNVIEKLVYFNNKLSTNNQVFYTNYVSNLVTSADPATNTQGSNDFADYLSSLMDQVHTAENNTAKDPQDNQANQIICWKQAIDGLDFNNDRLKPFSDVFIVIDSNLTDPIKDRDLLEKLYGLRMRLYFLLVQVNGNTFTASDNLTITYTDLAFRTGGAVVTVPGFDEALKFFDTYFDSLWGLDVVTLYKKTDSFFVKPLDTFWLTNEDGKLNYYLHVYADQPVQKVQFYDGDTPVTGLNVSDPIYKDQNLTIFKVVGSYTTAKVTYRVQFPTNAENINIVLLVSGVDSLLTNVAFTSDVKLDVASGALQFGSSSKQYPVAIAPAQTSLTLQNWNNGLSSVVMSPTSMTARGCTGATYTYITPYDWACDQSDNLYYARLDFTALAGQHTRTQLFTCIEGDPCLHGGTQNKDKSCSCPVGWIGGVCETPVCMNNGVIQSDKTCNCADGYQGFFCEQSLAGCSNQPVKPDLRNVITSLAFVIDRNSAEIPTLPDFSTWNLPGVQIVVVVLGCSYATQVTLSTTDPSLLAGALTYSKCNGQTLFDDLADSIVLALDSVVGDRSLVIAYTGTNDANASIQKWNLLRNRLTKQRSEFRIYSTATDIPTDLHQLAQFGNGIVIQAGQDNTIVFSDYITNYVYPLFSTSISPIPSQLSVVQSGSVSESDLETTSVVIQSDPNDNTPTSIIIHLWNATASIASIDANNGLVTTNPLSFTTFNNVAYTITFGKSNGKYSVEKLSNVQYSFGFQKDGNNEQLRLGLSPGDNFMSLYYSNVLDGHDVSQMPDIRLTTIADNGTSIILVPTTYKDNNHTGSCAYSYYAANLACTDALTVYVAQVQSLSTGKIARQNQNTFVCPNVDAASCVNGNITTGVCVCNADWEGVFCSLPICQNGGIREGQVCVCPIDTSGALCDLNQVRTTTTKLPLISTTAGPVQTTNTPGHTRAFAFIMDTHGLDDTLYNTSETIVREFMSMYAGSKTTLIYVLSDNDMGAHYFVEYANTNMLNAILTEVRGQRDWSGQPPDLKNAYQYILTAANTYTQKSFVSEDALTTVINYAFYVTSINASLSDQTALTSLKNDYNFNVQTIASVRYDVLEFPDTTQLDVFSPVSNVYTDWYQAVSYMTNLVKSADYTEPPAPTTSGRQPACVSAVQSNIYLSLQIVNSPQMDTYRGKMYDFASLFRTDFTLAPLPAAVIQTYRQQSFLNGWDCIDGNCLTNFGFCKAYYETFLKNTQTKPAKGDDPMYNKTMPYISFVLSDTTHCNRMEDPDTFKFVVWLWVSDMTDAETYAANITNNNYIHIFLPFGFSIDPDTPGFVGKLLAHNAVIKPGLLPEDMIIPHDIVVDGKTTAAMLVQKVWTMICRVSNIISPTSTAAPPGPLPTQQPAAFYELESLEELY